MQGTIQNREAFLNKIANRLGRERKSNVIRPHRAYSPQEDVLRGALSDGLVEVLKKQCSKIHTDFNLTTQAELSAAVMNVIESFGGGPIVTWKDERFKQFGLGTLLKEELPQGNVDVFEWDFTLGSENIKKANQANVGITISEMTLAESGTVLLFSGKDRGRTISFLPENSIVIIPKSTIVPSMTQAAKILREKVKNGEQVASCINYITGPSNSADIEMNLVVGVHGPVKAAYIVVEDC